jgi:uncharacterized LabA/DUF88 family protein
MEASAVRRKGGIMKRVAVFIDGSNFYHCCIESLGRADIDFKDFTTWLVGSGRDLIRTYYYNCTLPPDAPLAKRETQEKYYEALSKIPYFEVKRSRLAHRFIKCSKCGAMTKRWVEKGVDMHLGVDKLSLASKNLIDTAILVSGDADLRNAVQAVKDLGKHVELATLSKGRARALEEVCDVVHDIRKADMARFYRRTSAAKPDMA